ncbi:unnamed protein product [Sphagnum tenellum]
MDSFLAQKKAENQILEQKLQVVHAENESRRTALQARASEWWLRKSKTLVEKSKLEAEKVNIDREMKQLQQSTVLLNKRESIVDERRESIATGLTKTKAQLSSAEHALQMKTVELEKSSFDLQLLQDSYATLEFATCEMECGSITLKEKLAESEKSITILGQEKENVSHNMEKVAQELKVALELEQALDIRTGEVFGNENSDPQDTVSSEGPLKQRGILKSSSPTIPKWGPGRVPRSSFGVCVKPSMLVSSLVRRSQEVASQTSSVAASLSEEELHKLVGGLDLIATSNLSALDSSLQSLAQALETTPLHGKNSNL